MRQRSRFIAVAALALPALAACRAERKPGPIGTDLATPAALFVVGSGASATLLVANANFQLEFSSGSLAAIPLAAIDESKRINLVSDLVVAAVPLDSFAGQITATPDGSRVLVTNRLTEGDVRTAEDRVFFYDITNPQAPSGVDLDPAVEGMQNFLRVGHDPFGVQTVRLAPEGPGLPPRDRGFIANATDGSLSVLNLTPGTYCRSTPAPCVDDPLPFPRSSAVDFIDLGDPSNVIFDGPGVTPSVTATEIWEITFIEGPSPCPSSDGSPLGYWRVEGTLSGVQRTHACTDFFYATPNGVTFEIARERDADGNVVGNPPTQGDSFTFQTFRGDFLPTSRIPLSQSLPGAVVTGRGAGQLLIDPFRNRIYVTSRLTNYVYVLDASDYRFLGVFTITSNVTGRDSRGLALSPDGSELYVVNRAPDALLIIDPDAMPDQLEPVVIPDAVVATLGLSSGPSEIVLSPDGRYGFVTAFNADGIDLVDLQARVLRKTGHAGDGPFAIRLSADGLRGYVGQYFSSSIDVLDTDPASARFGEVITTIADEDYDTDFR